MPIYRRTVPKSNHPGSTSDRAGLSAQSTPSRWRRWRKPLLVIGSLVVVTVLTGGWLFLRAVAVVDTKKGPDQSRLSFFRQLTHIVTASDDQLQGESEDRINILLLGIGGPGHDGPYLTDTMIVASIKPSTKQVAMLSIPRDLVVDIPGYDYRKINNVLSFGRDLKYPGGGEALTVKVVSDLMNIPIQYYARIDFGGFSDIIDQVGGVDVTVDTAFTDYEYPTNNYGYQTIRFTTGPQHMDGDTALKFARSRHGNHGEGSDFARALRQQKIIVGLRQELMSASTWLNPKKISDVLGSLGSHSQTNMEVWEMLRLGNLAKEVDTTQIINRVLDDSPNNLLRAATGTNGAFILVPKDQTYSDIKFLAQNIFLFGQTAKEPITVAVANASGRTGLGEQVTNALITLGFTTVPTIPLPGVTIDRTVILNTDGQASPVTSALLKVYRHAQGTISLTHWEAQTKDTALRQALEPDQPTTNTNQSTGSANANTAAAKNPPTLILILGKDQPTPTTSRTTIPTITKPKTTPTNANTNANTNSTTKKKAPTNANTNTNAKVNTNSAPATSPVNSNTNTTINAPVQEATTNTAVPQ